ncbi:ribose-5-phosphate isomerase [Chromohalobacter marismortui]|uniref:Ribose-5-phosphate isomerase n=1 Tax=Chromohalobacter marismortui TaxID=42055 RepID=A0A4R7NMW6_9GAMM|nr:MULTISPECIES: RpiB/LacA/LacB family sugar-phosphate isomerase [Chromohalobacter]MCI0509648.1 RpiB/LacA/LacB family sugar-phosphate isomerase [Chromohalobacter sp.]MCI0593677.1 RpiB/LacA/LacB family sugar-phosphate isomerase [Chromohalobacter sp.]TDU21869.1 ribose-5-phosphate isomerase [Chromohalobacter marismortui]
MSDSSMAGRVPTMRIALGGDEAAFELKTLLIEHIRALGYEPIDYGTYNAEPVLYPDVAVKVARAIDAGDAERGVLVCGTGIGVAISANKVRGIRAAQAHDTYSAAKARSSNDAQIVTLGARVVGPELAKAVVTTFLDTEFGGGGSRAKVERILEYEREAFRDSSSV